jgi:hypothetical protein
MSDFTREELETMLGFLRADNAGLKEALRKEGEMRNGNVLFARMRMLEGQVAIKSEQLRLEEKAFEETYGAFAKCGVLVLELESQNKALVESMGRLVVERDGYMGMRDYYRDRYLETWHKFVEASKKLEAIKGMASSFQEAARKLLGDE